mmetsp:Transcript_59652/g.73035  ORF Transcript_59652/g.73035 Transcript_59652/m.73035 type:complete len:204 (-) Transcript_59652:420-1031(-)
MSSQRDLLCFLISCQGQVFLKQPPQPSSSASPPGPKNPGAPIDPSPFQVKVPRDPQARTSPQKPKNHQVLEAAGQDQSQLLPLAQHFLSVFGVFPQKSRCRCGQSFVEVQEVLLNLKLQGPLQPFPLQERISTESSLEICFWRVWHGCQCYLHAPPDLGLQLRRVHVSLAWIWMIWIQVFYLIWIRASRCLSHAFDCASHFCP